MASPPPYEKGPAICGGAPQSRDEDWKIVQFEGSVVYRKSHTLCQTVALRAGHSECGRRARVCHDALGTPTPPRTGGPQPSQTSATRHRRTGGPGLKPKTRFLVPFDSFAESGPEPNPETKKKDPGMVCAKRERRRPSDNGGRRNSTSQLPVICAHPKSLFCNASMIADSWSFRKRRRPPRHMTD